MSKRVISVRFRTAGKVYYFSPEQLEIKKNDHVIVETARGVEYGTVVSDIKEIDDDELAQPLKPVIRLATAIDDEQQKENGSLEKEALVICAEKVRARELEMKLIDAEYTFDRNKLLFYFTSDGRVDFRELVKDLASVFRTRIELRQIGVRDETKMMGGIGSCGRVLCCHTHLPDFAPVSIKMAKEQGLSLNPSKISGMCGRLMCCLKNEEDTYEELNRKLPSVGDVVTSENGEKGVVHSVNVLRQRVKVIIEDGEDKEIKEYSVEELKFKRGHHKDNKDNTEGMSAEEIRELELLEKEEKQEEQDSKENSRKENRDNYKENRREHRNNRDSREHNKEYTKENNRENINKDNNKENKELANKELANKEFGNKEFGNKEGNSKERSSRERNSKEGNFRDNKEKNFDNKKEFKNQNSSKDYKGGKEFKSNKDNRDNKDGRNRKNFKGSKPVNNESKKTFEDKKPSNNGESNN